MSQSGFEISRKKEKRMKDIKMLIEAFFMFDQDGGKKIIKMTSFYYTSITLLTKSQGR